VKKLDTAVTGYLNDFYPFFDKFVDELLKNGNAELREIFRYHLGLDDPAEKRGKHIRSLLTLICCDGTGANWHNSLPAAAAIELIHNFSLIHDDIEDDGDLRRGKATVWKKWGVPKALNAGDAMFVSAFLALSELRGKVDDVIALDASLLLNKTCFELTSGQQMDIGFENRERISEEEYLEMIAGKTAALIACSTQMGALIGGHTEEDQVTFADFGRSLGVAFQIYDDWLGVWGDPDSTGKTATGDIIERKKSLPVLLGLEKSERFSERYSENEVTPQMAETLAAWLREDGVEAEVKQRYAKWSTKALTTIDELHCSGPCKETLTGLTNKLLIRTK